MRMSARNSPANRPPKLLIWLSVTAGPIAPLFKFEDSDDLIHQANDTEIGLAACFFARDMAQVHRVAEALEYAMVGINTGQISTAVAPFGGVRQLGPGREGLRYGRDDCSERKYLRPAV